MREPIDNTKIGDEFSKVFNNLKCTANMSLLSPYQNYETDILTLWECDETNRKFAFFVSSGIREITNRLYSHQIKLFKKLTSS